MLAGWYRPAVSQDWHSGCWVVQARAMWLRAWGTTDILAQAPQAGRCVYAYMCVCVCVGWRGASGNWWLYSPQMAGGEVSQTRSKGQSERTIHSWCSRLPDENVTMKKRRTKIFLLCCTNRVTNYGHFHNWNKQMIWHCSDQNEVRVYFPKTFSLLLHPLNRPKAASFFNGPVNILVFQ